MANHENASTPLPNLWPYGLLCAVTAVALSLSKVHEGHDSDSLLPVLESLYRWQPYFWTQNRIGMLVPLLAIPIKSPFANLVFQSTLYIFTGLLSFFLLPRYILRNRAYPLVGIACLALFLGAASPYLQLLFFLITFYGLWIALGLGALVLLEPTPDGCIPTGRRFLALLLFFLAHWVFIAACVLLGPLIALRFLAQEMSLAGMREACRTNRTRRWAACARFFLQSQVSVSLVLLALGLAAAYALSLTAPRWTRIVTVEAVPPGQWLPALAQLFRHSWEHAGPYLRYVVAAAGVMLLLLPSVRRGLAEVWRGCAVVLAAAVIYFCFMGTRGWISANAFHVRYALPALFLVQAGVLALAVGPVALAVSAPGRRRLQALGMVLVPAAAMLSWGWPSVATARAALERISHPAVRASDVLGAGATHIMGSYSSVWTTMFQVNMVRYERGEAPLWGITYRGEPTRKLWWAAAPENVRIAVPLGEQHEAALWARAFALGELEPIDRRGTVAIWRPKQPPPR